MVFAVGDNEISIRYAEICMHLMCSDVWYHCANAREKERIKVFKGLKSLLRVLL